MEVVLLKTINRCKVDWAYNDVISLLTKTYLNDVVMINER